MNNLESVAIWKRLPEEPVVIILDKLLESIDYVRFAAVCKEWYRLAKDNYTRDTDRWYHRPRPPMLLLPPTAPFLRPRLFSFSQQRTYNNFRLQVPSPRVGNIFCCGFGHGWLAKVDVYDDGHRRSVLVWRIELVNPFRQATTTLTLPPLAFERDLFTLAKIPKAPKVLVSSDPALNPDNLWVLAFLTDGDEFVFHKIGHNIFKNIKATRRSSWFTDAIFYKGRFYVIDNTDGTILVFDVEKVQWRALKIAGFRSTYAYRAYLVESTKGDLLCVKRYVKKIGQYRMNAEVTEGFRVYKLELDNQVATQVEVTNMEDETLFVGDTPSVSVLASNFCGCRPDSIYFTDDLITHPIVGIENLPGYEPEGIKYDVGLFSLADKTITRRQQGRHFGPPVWITTPPPFDPLPAVSSSLELTTIVSKEDKKKRRLKHWLNY